MLKTVVFQVILIPQECILFEDKRVIKREKANRISISLFFIFYYWDYS